MVLIQLPGPVLIGVSQGGTLGSLGQTEVPQLAFAGGQSAADLAQRLRLPELAK